MWASQQPRAKLSWLLVEYWTGGIDGYQHIRCIITTLWVQLWNNEWWISLSPGLFFLLLLILHVLLCMYCEYSVCICVWSVVSAKNSASSWGAFPIKGGQRRALLAKRVVKQRALLVKRMVKTESALGTFSNEGSQNIFSRHLKPKTFWLNPKDRRPNA